MSRNFTNQPISWLRANHPELISSSGAVDGSQGKNAADVARLTTKFLVEAGILSSSQSPAPKRQTTSR